MDARAPARRTSLAAIAACVPLLAGCGAPGSPAALHGRILAVGAESQYANVISAVGGRYVDALAIIDNPNADPHGFEASAAVAQTVARARLVVQNGLGYDAFMNAIESASGNRARVIDVRALLRLPRSTANPHLWYGPRTMPAVARAIAAALSAIAPRHAAYFRARAARFVASLRPWRRALARFAARHRGTPVATTEPIADDMLAAAGMRNLTPFSLQADIMNGTDPAPQAVSLENRLLSAHRVRALVYNEQVTDSVTRGFLAVAARAHVPVVGVSETMPAGASYASWMMAELRALERAVDHGVSTRRLAR
ncbi:MAG TPA: zinc ABC transporter substrate-binding protein [Solirubrobacteraceae bacterium]|nr:zinc ABC transporter substrate-binding protein [Solirubrobacteraceae bacterium]